MHSTLILAAQALPAARAATKWELFAAKKGIKPKSAAARQNLRYDAAADAWVPRWGHNGANKAPDRDWLVEVDDRKERELPEGTTLRGLGRRDRKERVKRGERLMRANERRARKDVK
jgi:regulator of ribosome biosynthesis